MSRVMRWDPGQYLRYAGERARPFLDLLARVSAEAPRRVVDVGCGPGTLTALLAQRWPDATIEGIDSSPDMIAAATEHASERVGFRVADAREWEPPTDCDVVISNAALQWIPEHDTLLERWAAALPPGGRLAFQVPGNFSAPSHTEMRALAAEPRWADRLHGVLRHADAVGDPTHYATLLMDAGLDVDAWETTYVHVLDGEDPVVEWMRGTALRPVLDALDADEAAEFTAELAHRLRRPYPPGPRGTLLPFRRIFVVAGRRD